MNRKYKNIILLTLLFFLTTCHLKAQTITPKFDDLDVCLPNCVIQDKNGFIWIGAQEGLLRYDGNKLKKYQNIPFDSTSISGNWVSAISEDEKGNLWVATLNGLNYFNQIKEQFTNFNLIDKNDSTLASRSIPKMLVNDDGSLWIATTDCGVFFTKIDEAGKPEFTFHDLIDGINLKDFTEKLQVWDLYKDGENCLWIGTMNSGLFKLDLETGEVEHFINDSDNPTSLSHNTARSICEDSLGNIWIGTGAVPVNDAGGLNKYDRRTGKFLHFRYNPNDPSSLFSDWVSPILIDSKGVMWMCYPDEGINSIPVSELLGSMKPNFRKSYLKEIYSTQSIYEDRIGNIWIAPTGWKLYKYDPNQNPFYWYHRVEGSSNTMSVTGTQCIYFDRIAKYLVWTW